MDGMKHFSQHNKNNNMFLSGQNKTITHFYSNKMTYKTPKINTEFLNNVFSFGVL